MDDDSFVKLNEKPGWPRLSAEARALVTANFLYYQYGTFPAAALVPMTPPPLIRRPRDTEGKPSIADRASPCSFGSGLHWFSAG